MLSWLSWLGNIKILLEVLESIKGHMLCQSMSWAIRRWCLLIDLIVRLFVDAHIK
jgi:hypothetical protein